MSPSPSPSYAGVRFDPDAPRPHVESYFLKANDPESPRALWVRHTIYAGRHDASKAVAEAWAIFFDRDRGHVAVKSQVPLDRAHFGRDALDIRVDGVTLDPHRARGRIETGDRAVGWDLALTANGPPLLHFPRAFLYEGPFPSSKLVSLLPDARVSGSIDAFGEKVTVDGWPALVGHNWGKRNAHTYAWGHCNAWDGGEDVMFEGTSARVKLGPVLSPVSTILCVRHRGVRYELNGLAQMVKNRGSIGLRRWSFRGAGELVRIEGELWASDDDFVGLHYPNPDAPMTYCLNTKIAHARIELGIQKRPRMLLESTRAALEIGTHDAHHGIKMYL
ncbi:tocopherol cyclase family protein [Pendulispora albinea]|uniref:Carotenoid 1,2-hydratase n=1 Tax=Pendulispora albinea TaxID=2741071 RepID=A0ABZ2M8M8_9BACT